MSLSPGARLGPYEVFSLLGAGGMGEVYRARDVRVDRPVALKVLPEEYFEDEERRARFGREARTLASLNHPGIAILYSFEEISGRHLLAMELIEGGGLDQRIASGPLPLEELLSFARQIADALAAAHEKGVVHRDLKPANIKVSSDGRVKLLDFGLAKKFDSAPVGGEDETSTGALTQQGVVMGTVPYMSPEQVSGRDVDHRTDIFSLGVILYEMATGHRPFQGNSSAELISSILRDSPPAVTQLRADLPRDLARIIRRCLEKDTRDRLQTARDLHNELKELRGEAGSAAGAGASAAPVAIAVLPFSDMSPAKDQDYLCEGMAEEIMNALVGIDGIRVASRTSAFRARRQGEDLPAIARSLNVGHVLEGSVRTAGNRIRVTAQLTDVATGFQLWSERFDREAADIFAVQDEITAGVVEAVKTRLAPGQPALEPRRQLKNLEAYRHYLKGRHLRYTKNDHAGALLCFEQAVALDPSHGPSWVGLADINVLAAAYGMKSSCEAYAAAKTALSTAARLQGESGEALYVEGMIAFGERRWNDSGRVLARATHIEPGHVQARCWTAVLLCIRGRTEEAIQALERAREIDPLAPYPYAMTGMCLMVARRAEEADRFLDQALAFDEDNILALWVSGAAKVGEGRFDLAISRLERALTVSHHGAFIHGTLGWALAAAGRAEEARSVLEALRARPAPATTVLPEAWILAALGEREAAWQVLVRACEEKQLLVVFTGLPGFDPLRSDPGFPAFLERLGLPVA